MSDVQYTPPPPPPPIVPPTVPPSTPPPAQFDFARPFSFVFDDPRWLQKIVIGGLFYLAGVVIVGWFFLFGYVAQVTRNLIAGVERPLPEWENVGTFFNEGARLVALTLCWMVPIFLLMIGFIVPAVIADNAGSESAEGLAAMLTGCMLCLMVPLGLVLFLLMPASLLLAVVDQRFGAGFELGRIWNFIRANIGNYLLAIVVAVIARFIGDAGTGLLCIGVIFTGFWSLLITAHAYAQVYRLSAVK